jgi:biotin carboxyl carrier protein
VIEEVDGVVRRYTVASDGTAHHVRAGARDLLFDDRARFPAGGAKSGAAGLTAPMPCRVVKVLVTEGELCAGGQTLVILEAMKMEHAVRAAAPGRVRKLHVREGDPVDAGAPLLVLDPAEEAP